MERKAEYLSRRIVGGGNLNNTSSSSSSSSSTRSISPRDFISEINAVFSRHRPLGAKHKVSRASRVLVNKPENPQGSGNIESKLPETGTQREAEKLLGVCVGENKDSSLENRSNSSDESILTPPSITETVTNIQDNKMCLYEHQQGVDRSKMPEEAPSSTESLPKEHKLSTDILGVTFGRREGQFDNLVPLDNNYSDQRDLQNLDMHESIETNILENRDNFHHDRKPSCPASMSVVTDPPHQCAYVPSQVLNNSLASEPYHAIEKATSSQVPSNDSSWNVDMGVSKSSKVEKSSHKKKYDPNVFFKVNGKLYQKLGKIGSGGSSEVYKVVTSDCTIYALKKIKLKGRDYPMAYGFCQEILYLNKLKGRSNIIQLIDYEVTDKNLLQEVMNGCMTVNDGKISADHSIYMVLEYGEIDLAHMLSHKFVEVRNSSYNTDENWLRFYWQQMLEAVNTIHEERIVHSDLKPANFLLVKGSLKLIDFGIAKAILSDTTNIQREAQVGTLNYMSPEAFMWNEQDPTGGTIKCGRPSDIWSLGCILYQMVYGKTPFADHKTFWAKFKVITDKNHEIAYHEIPNPSLVDLMKRCLAWDRNQRWRIPQLLNHPFLLPPPLPKFSLDDPEWKRLFEKISLYWDHPDVSRLCSELREVCKQG